MLSIPTVCLLMNICTSLYDNLSYCTIRTVESFFNPINNTYFIQRLSTCYGYRIILNNSI